MRRLMTIGWDIFWNIALLLGLLWSLGKGEP